MARRKKQQEPGPSAPLYMATYGDMVTLLLCFFVLLYSFSTLDAKKFEQMAQSMSAAFNVVPSSPATPSPDTTGVGEGTLNPERGDVSQIKDSTGFQVSRQMLALMQKAEETIKNEQLTDEIKVTSTERGVVISFSEQILFAEGSVQVYPEALRILYKLGALLENLPNQLAVEGHTDSSQPVNSVYGDNWGLSAARAASVASYLNTSIRIHQDRLMAVGLGASRPTVPNDTAEHMRLNRKVDIVILSEHSIR